MSPQHSPQALTIRSQKGRMGMLVSDCAFCAAYDPKQIPEAQRPPFQPFKALWDTGATSSVITQNVVDGCGLKPTGMVQVHGVHGPQMAETFIVNVALPPSMFIVNVKVTKAVSIVGADALIGMDIITIGDFSITNVNGLTVFSFRTPSLHEVDFVRDINQQNAAGKAKTGQQFWNNIARGSRR